MLNISLLYFNMGTPYQLNYNFTKYKKKTLVKKKSCTVSKYGPVIKLRKMLHLVVEKWLHKTLFKNSFLTFKRAFLRNLQPNFNFVLKLLEVEILVILYTRNLAFTISKKVQNFTQLLL